jgi:hypothetical protein
MLILIRFKKGIIYMKRIAILAAAVIAAGMLTGSANAVTPAEPGVPDNSVASAEVVDGSLYQKDVNPAVVDVFRTPKADVVSSWNVRDNGIYDQDLHSSAKVGRTTKVESDSPYPGATQLGEFAGNGANSTSKFLGDSGAALQRAWVRCADGKVAIGGGFQRADESIAAIRNLQIVTSSPTQISGNNEVYNPIPGDAAGSLLPNAWLVEGFNLGTTDLIVRPSVICAAVSGQ